LYSYRQSERKILITDANNLISSVIEAASATIKNDSEKKKRKRDFFENFKLYNQETQFKRTNLPVIKEKISSNEPIDEQVVANNNNNKLSLPEIPVSKEEKKLRKIIEPKTVAISKTAVEKDSNLNSISLPQISNNSNNNANANSNNSDTTNLIAKVKKKSKNPNKEKKKVFSFQLFYYMLKKIFILIFVVST
jgi:hypothetical protein